MSERPCERAVREALRGVGVELSEEEVRRLLEEAGRRRVRL